MIPAKDDHVSLSDAIESGDIGLVKSMIEKFPELVSHPDWTPPPIHCAVLWNQPKIAELLLDNGADIETLDPDRQTTPLRYSIMFAKTDLIPMLLDRQANSGAIVEGGTTAMQLAEEAAGGAYEEYEDLPSRDAYSEVVAVLREWGLS